MHHAARGARSVGGLTIGILRTLDPKDANPFIDLILPTPLGYARNVLTASACECMIALAGGTGTIQEMTFALDFERPLLSFGGPAVPTPVENPSLLTVLAGEPRDFPAVERWLNQR